jgi:ribonuclease E
MTKRMLIDAAHPEETRVVIVDSNRVEELDFESRHKRQLRGNVYLARVTRVEPSLQAAFIEYGGNRHGFLAFSEIHPDYYRIPEADKLALKEQEEEDQRQAEEEEEKRKAASAKRRTRTQSKDDADEEEDEEDSDDQLDDDAEDELDDEEDERDENLDPDDDDATDESDAEVADEQVNVAVKRRKRISRRRYKIQEVIKRGQILLVQAVKEERGNKGAAMTTYLSLAGRYCVLMPNTPRGGGISRKIANGSDRKRLKSIMNDLEVPKGMGVIVRTAGAKRTKAEIERDYEYLSRLWSEIRETTMESSAPALIHEEGNLVKRSIRDLYNKDIEEVLVQGNDAYDTASNFINMLMPSHAENVKHYDDEIPLFLRYGAEKQIENSLDATVQLKSGGYLVIHPTEALVSVDVNSGRSTKERNIERTALRTNLEAAEELARQMRLRDLAGLIVVDFIDMDENKNNRAVERKMKEMLAQDRARIQTSRISQFGLMEISRQRRRRSLLEGSTTSCPHCSGVGRKRTVESSALAAIRAVEEFAVRGKAKRIRLKTSPDVALYLLNEKRDLLTQVDQVADVFTEVVGDDEYIRPHYELEVIEKREDKRADPLLKIERDFKKEQEEAKRKPKPQKAKVESTEDDAEADETSSSETDSDDENRKSGRKRSRRGRRGGRGRGRRDDQAKSADTDADETESSEVETPKSETDEKPKRARRRRGGSQRSEENQSESVKSDDSSKSEDEAPKRGRRRRAPSKVKEAPVETAVEESPVVEDKQPVRRSTTRRKAPARKSADAVKEAEVAEAVAEKPKRTRKAPPKKKADLTEATTEATKPARKRRAPTKAKAEDSAVEDKPKRTRKAPARKPAEQVTEAEAETPKAPRKRKAPAKKAPAAAAKAADADAKPKRTRKAPVKKAGGDAKVETAKPTRTRKAPVKKALEKETDVKAEAEAPKRTRKSPVKKAPSKAAATKKAPVKKAPVKKAPVKKAVAKPTDSEAKPKATRVRKAPVKKAPVKDVPTEPAAVVTPVPKTQAPKPQAPKTPAPKPVDVQASPAKKSPLGWWKSRKKD